MWHCGWYAAIELPVPFKNVVLQVDEQAGGTIKLDDKHSTSKQPFIISIDELTLSYICTYTSVHSLSLSVLYLHYLFTVKY